MRSKDKRPSVERLKQGALITATILTLTVIESWNSRAEAQAPAKKKAGIVEKTSKEEWRTQAEHYLALLNANGVPTNSSQLVFGYSLWEAAQQYQKDGYDADLLFADLARTSAQLDVPFERTMEGAGKNARHYYDAYQKIFSETKRRMIARDSTLAARFENGEQIPLDRKIFDAVKGEVKDEYQRMGADPFVTDMQIGVFLEPTTEPPIEPVLKLPSTYKLKVKPLKTGPKSRARTRGSGR